MTHLQASGVENRFDLRKVQENIEAGQIAGQVAFKAIGDLAEARQKAALRDRMQAEQDYATAQTTGDTAGMEDAVARWNAAEQQLQAWSDGSPMKVALHATAGALMAAMGGGNVAGGALGALSNEAMISVIDSVARQSGYEPGSAGHKTLMEFGSLFVGAATAAVASASGAGGATALSGTQNNYLRHQDVADLARMPSQCAADDTTCRDNVVKEADRRSAANSALLAACTTQQCVDNHVSFAWGEPSRSA